MSRYSGLLMLTLVLFAGCGDSETDPCSVLQAPIIFPGTSVARTCTTTTLRCEIDARGLQTTVSCLYGTDLGADTSSWTGDAGSAYGPVQITFMLSSLLPDTLYLFQWKAWSIGGTTATHVDSFTTLPANCPPETFVTCASPEGTPDEGYGITIFWFGLDLDGDVDHFELRMKVRGVWAQWEYTLARDGHFYIDPGDEMGWCFEVRAVDNDGAVDPTPAWFAWTW